MTKPSWRGKLLPWLNRGKSVYRVYVIKQRKSGGSEVLPDTRTQTPSFDAAAAAFWHLQGLDYDSAHLLLMTKNNKQINAYRYNSQPGERDYLDKNSELKQ